MELSFFDYLQKCIDNPMLLTCSIIIIGVLFANGLTDIPNSVSTCVSTRAMSPQKALIMGAVLNGLGVFVMTFISSTVAQTIYNIVDFGQDSASALVALSAGLIAIVCWSIFAWVLGIPTSESHSLVAGISGAAIALQGSLSGINPNEWKKILYGLVISTILGFVAGFVITRIIEKICRKMDRRHTIGFFKNSQIFTSAFMAFLNGAQDGQKFMGIFILALVFASGQTGSSGFGIPIWLMALCSIVMALGTIIGGRRIIKTVGMKMVKLEAYQGFAADLSGAVCIFASSLTGIPVSTNQTKSTAIMGVGAARNIKRVNWGVAKNMLLAWIFTFPIAGMLGFVFTRVVMMIGG